MKRSAIVATIVLVLLSAFIFIAAPTVGHNALAIDNVHWEGYPLTPCFVDGRHCGGHALGSDENGRDIVARLIVGGAVTLSTAFLALLIELSIAIGLSLLARHAGRVMDHIVIAFAQGMTALPRLPYALLLAIVAFSMMPRGVSPNTFEIAAYFGIIFWPEAFLAFRKRGLPSAVARRGIGDLITILLVSSTIEFFGYGHMLPTPTWGNMLVNAESNIEIAWWTAVFPALCIFVTVLLLDIVRRGLPPVQGAAEKVAHVMPEPSPA